MQKFKTGRNRISPFMRTVLALFAFYLIAKITMK